jgi:hypothetical protein
MSNEKCTHCGKLLKFDEGLGYRRARIIHLVKHSVNAALGSKFDLPDRSYWEITSCCPKDTWEEAASAAHDEILDVIDESFGILLGEEGLARAEVKSIGWLKSNYPSV